MKLDKRTLIIGLILLVVLGAPIAAGLLTDWWWFDSLGFEAVFLTRLGAQAALFAAGVVLFTLMFAGNAILARSLAIRAGWMRGPPAHPQALAWEAMFWLGLVGAGVGFGLAVGKSPGGGGGR